MEIDIEDIDVTDDAYFSTQQLATTKPFISGVHCTAPTSVTETIRVVAICLQGKGNMQTYWLLDEDRTIRTKRTAAISQSAVTEQLHRNEHR